MEKLRFWCLDKLDLIRAEEFNIRNSVDYWLCKEKIRTLDIMLRKQNGYYSITYIPELERFVGSVKQYKGIWRIR